MPKKKTKKHKVGIIGCGMILPRHLESIEQNSEHFELVALCDIDKKKVESVAEEHDVPRFTNYKEMLKAMKVELVSDGVKAKYVPDDRTVAQCRAMGERIAERLGKLPRPKPVSI